MKKWFSGLLIGFLLVGVMAFSSQSSSGGRTVLEFETMVGVPRPYTGATNAIRGVPGGGLPWVIRSASGELKASGEVQIIVRGLVLDPNDQAVIDRGLAGVNPSAQFKAIVSCLSVDDLGNAVTVNLATAAFDASPQGNAKIKDHVDLPSPCIAPIVFVTSPNGSWFASTGN